MPYRFKFHSTARQQFRQLPRGLRKEFVEEIQGLLDEPYPPYILAMRDEWVGSYRIHVNSWRLIYRVDERGRLIYIERIAKRDANTYL